MWHTSRTRSEHDDNQEEFADNVVYTSEEAIKARPDVAFITSPSTTHISLATVLAQNGVDLFIEKPLSANLYGVEDLLRTQKEHHGLLMVGYNLRFHKPLQYIKSCIDGGKIGKILSIRAEVGQYLPEWRPGSDYRTSVSAKRDLGGGAVLELSHEIDYTMWFVGEPTSVTAQTGHLSDLEIDVEDTAEIVMRFANGAIGSIHLDMIQRPPSRNCKVIGTKGTVIWDGTNDSVILYSNGSQEYSSLHPAKKEDWNNMYLAELKHFISCVKKRETPLISGDDGKRVLKVALCAMQSSQEQRTISL